MKYDECVSCGARLIPESMHCPVCGAPADHEVPTEVRCECGFLLCKLDEDAIEVKCRRCKRLVMIPVEGLEDRFDENKRNLIERRSRPPEYHPHRHGEGKGQYCSSCGLYKPSVMYGKCLDCRTQAIKVQYKTKPR